MKDVHTIDELERRIIRMEQHIREQDTEVFRLTKRLDTLCRNLKKLELRMGEGSAPSPIDPDSDGVDQKPPHY